MGNNHQLAEDQSEVFFLNELPTCDPKASSQAGMNMLSIIIRCESTYHRPLLSQCFVRLGENVFVHLKLFLLYIIMYI